MPVWAMVFLFFMWFMVDSASKAHFSSTNVLPSRLEKLRKKIKYGSVRTEGFQRAIANFVCFHALWSRPQARNLLLQ